MNWHITTGPEWTCRFRQKNIEFDANWVLKQIKLITQVIKEKKSNIYDSVYKIIGQLFNLWQVEYKWRNKTLIRILDLSSLLKISGIDVTTHSPLIYTDKKKLTTADKKWSKKEATSPAYEARTAMFFKSISDYNRFGFLIEDLKQDILKGKNNHPRNVTSTYDMIKRFGLSAPRHHHTECTRDRGNMNNNGGCGGWECTFKLHTET